MCGNMGDYQVAALGRMEAMLRDQHESQDRVEDVESSQYEKKSSLPNRVFSVLTEKRSIKLCLESSSRSLSQDRKFRYQDRSGLSVKTAI